MARLLMGNQVITLVKHKKTDTGDAYTCYSMPDVDENQLTSGME